MHGILFLMFSLVVLHVQTDALLFGSDKKDQVRLARSRLEFEPDSTLMNINNITMWVYSNGLSGTAPDGESGTVYPRGTGGVVFADGIVWGGRVEDGAAPSLRVGGQTYSTGLVPGSILSPGQAEDFNAPSVNRVWRIRRDYLTADISRDAAEFYLKDLSEVSTTDVELLRNRYARDWLDWPWDKGAPFYDASGDGVYTPEFRADGTPVLYPEADEPGLVNADQVIWFVSNDLDPGTVQSLYGSPPIGLEVQTTLWAFAEPEPLANVIFNRYRFIYKGTARATSSARIDSLHMSQWSDVDLGSFGDDFVGVDRGLEVGYAYNSREDDIVFSAFGQPPPAVGYDLLSGFIVPRTYNGKEGIFDLKRRPRSDRLPMTGFAAFGAGSSDSDPTRGGDYNGTLQWWNMLRGYRPRPESPPTPWFTRERDPTKFVLPGDPVTGSGFTDSNRGDRRLYFVSGPVNMSLGDSNEVYIGLVGGLGSDRLNSISAMRFHSRHSQQALDDLFASVDLPQPPVLEATELDGEILLIWSASQSEVERVEQYAQRRFSFEGYNIYQLPAPDSDVESGIKLVTFDLENGTRSILQDEFDPASGALISRVVQVASNSGIFRSLAVHRDTLHSEPLYNGQTYHFAITSYSHNPDLQAPIRWAESLPAVVSVVPHSVAPGERLRSVVGDSLPVVHGQGPSAGKVMAIVHDPTKLTGDDYDVVFSEGNEQQIVWHLLNVSRGDTVLRHQSNQSGDEIYLIAEGLQIVVEAPQPGFRSFDVVVNAAGPLDPPEGGAADFAGFPVSAPVTARQQVGSGRWLFHTGDNGGSSGNGSRGDYGSFLRRSLRNDNFSRVVPFDWEMRFTARGSWAIRAFSDGALLKVPFELWNIGSTTPDDASDDYRVIPWFLESDLLGQLQTDPEGLTHQLDPNDHSASGADDDPYTPWVYWRIPRDNSPGEAGYDAFVSAIDTTRAFQSGVDASGSYDFASPEAFGRTVLINLDSDDVSDGEVAPGTQMVPEEGTIFRITTLKPNAEGDVFSFSTRDYAPVSSREQAQQDVERINVFPNPYLGPFNLSTRFAKGFVTFAHLPPQATVRIFTLAGAPVRKLEKMDEGQFLKWDLRNEFERFVGTGIYLAHVEMPELGVSKVLKLMVVPQ